MLKLLPLPNGIPRKDVYRRVLSALKPEAFQACFVNWLQSLRASAAAVSGVEQPVLAVDGKTLRRSHDHSRGLSALHSVSVWATDFGLTLGQVATDQKSNEITAIPELLRLIDIKGAIITIDAMGTQKAIARQIIAAEADYVLSLKGASDEAAKRLAQRENASGLVGGVSLADKDPVLASVLLDLSQNAALSASLDVGSEVMRELGKVGTVHRHKVQQAGLLVLKSPDVPSILVETNFISNPGEEKKLKNNAHQKRLAAAILAGIRSYFHTNPPPDTQIALDLKRTPTKQVSHVIGRGDTLSQIAERYNVSMSAIRAANKLSNDRIRVGQTLRIPIFAGT